MNSYTVRLPRSNHLSSRVQGLRHCDRSTQMAPHVAIEWSWAHSCCSRAALDEALADTRITAIESDLIVSKVSGRVVMAHPPATDSDLSFDEFFARALADGRRALKLDFKEPAALAPCLKVLANHAAALYATRQVRTRRRHRRPARGKTSRHHRTGPSSERSSRALRAGHSIAPPNLGRGRALSGVL